MKQIYKQQTIYKATDNLQSNLHTYSQFSMPTDNWLQSNLNSQF